jgi:uncharacterized membrane protein YphA (DoxX/SURF4 family)/thiol-disulfide isomerase/thioredoxin
MDSFVVGAQLFLAAVFAFAGTAKLFDLPGSRQAVAAFGVPARLAPVVGVLVPLAELAAALMLLFVPTARWGALLALLLLLAFMAGVANAMRKGLEIDCGCFGKVYSATASSATLVRNAILAALAAVVLVHGPGPAINDWFSARSAGELVVLAGVILALVLAAVVWWRWWQKRTERRDAELRGEEETRATPQDELPRAPDRDPYGHIVGTPAPAFELPDLHGNVHSLDSLLALGRPVVLMFMAIGCGPCAQVRPDWSRWRASLRERLTLVVISDGDRSAVESRWQDLGDEYVLLDPEEKMLRAYALASTPTALVVDRNGLIASTPYSGILGAELVVRRALRIDPGTVEPASPQGPTMPPVLQYGTGSA